MLRMRAPKLDSLQLVERDLAKVEVAGSNPVFRSKAPATVPFLCQCIPHAGMAE